MLTHLILVARRGKGKRGVKMNVVPTPKSTSGLAATTPASVIQSISLCDILCIGCFVTLSGDVA